MGNFNRDGGGNFGGNQGGSRFGGGGRDSHGGGFQSGGKRDVMMHQATCAECRKSCEVPFKPTNDRPVYCKDCFMNKGGSSGDSRRDNRAPRGDFNSRPFSKPRFEVSQGGGSQSGSDIKRQLETINAKLDKLISTFGVNGARGDGLKEAVKEVVKSGVKSPATGKTKKASTKKVAKKK